MTTTKLDEFHGLRGCGIFDLMTYEEYLQTKHWQHVRAKTIQRDDYRCRLCGNDGELHVHHGNYDCLGAEMSTDVTTLCATCHARHHNKQPSHQAHAGAVCPECGAEFVLRIEIERLEGRG